MSLGCLQLCASNLYTLQPLRVGGQGRKFKREEGHENVPEGGADVNKGPEVGQPKDLPQDACQPA